MEYVNAILNSFKTYKCVMAIFYYSTVTDTKMVLFCLFVYCHFYVRIDHLCLYTSTDTNDTWKLIQQHPIYIVTKLFLWMVETNKIKKERYLIRQDNTIW